MLFAVRNRLMSVHNRFSDGFNDFWDNLCYLHTRAFFKKYDKS